MTTFLAMLHPRTDDSRAMKTYRGTRSNNRNVVTVDGQQLPAWRHPDQPDIVQFAWGGQSVGAERLARSILADCLDETHALMLAQELMENVISKLNADWEITSDDVEQWRDYTCAMRAAIDDAEWTPAGSGRPPRPVEVSADLPRLLIDPNFRQYTNHTDQ